MENTEFKPLSDLQKSKIIEGILSDDVEFLTNYFRSCTPYQLHEWASNNDTPRYINLMILEFMEQDPVMANLFFGVGLAFYSDEEKREAIQNGGYSEDDFLPKNFPDFHKSYYETYEELE